MANGTEKMRLICCCLFIVAMSSCGKDENTGKIDTIFFPCNVEDIPVQAEDYNGYPTDCINVLVSDDFSNNDNNWREFNNSEYTVSIDNGTYNLRSNDGGNYIFTTQFDGLEDLQNYQLEADLIFESGGNDKPCSFTFGGNGGLDGLFSFEIIRGGFYRIIEIEDAMYTRLYKDWTESSGINPNGTNKLTIRFYEEEMLFFINENLVSKSTNITFYGTEIGFIVGQDMQINIDDFSYNSLRE